MPHIEKIEKKLVESWSHWKIIIIDKNGEREADPDLYTRLGRVKIKFKQEIFSVSTILNSIFNKGHVSEDRKIKAKLISILFSFQTGVQLVSNMGKTILKKPISKNSKKRTMGVEQTLKIQGERMRYVNFLKYY